VKRAVREAGIEKPRSCHTFCHTFATHMIEGGYDICTVQELLGHVSVETRLDYTHVLNKGVQGVISPLDGSRRGRQRTPPSSPREAWSDPLFHLGEPQGLIW
jgi:integrase